MTSDNSFEEIGIDKIMECLPHRYPMLLVDRIVKMDTNSITGIKNVTFNEPHFIGHFPNKPIMPGVLIIESMAQTAGVLVYKNHYNDSQRKNLVYFVSINNVKFRKAVVPGDTLEINVTLKKISGSRCSLTGIVNVDGKKVAEAEFITLLVDKNK